MAQGPWGGRLFGATSTRQWIYRVSTRQKANAGKVITRQIFNRPNLILLGGPGGKAPWLGRQGPQNDTSLGKVRSFWHTLVVHFLTKLTSSPKVRGSRGRAPLWRDIIWPIEHFTSLIFDKLVFGELTYLVFLTSWFLTIWRLFMVWSNPNQHSVL